MVEIGVDHIAAVARKILRREERAARRNRLRHVVGDFAFVESARALGGDGLQRCRQRRKADDVAFLRRGAVEQIMLCGAGIGLELADMAAPVPGDARGNRKSAFGIFDRRLQRAIEPEAAVALEDRVPGIDRARHRDGMDRRADFGHALGAQALRTKLWRRRGRSRYSPTPACLASTPARSSRRRCRSCAARPRTARRQAATAASAALPPARSVSTAARVASGCEVAAMPSQAITGERPGSWKSRLMTRPDVADVQDETRVDALDRQVALRRAQASRAKPPSTSMKLDHQQQEESRGRGLLDQHEFDQHAEEQDQRQSHGRPRCGCRCGSTSSLRRTAARSQRR